MRNAAQPAGVHLSTAGGKPGSIAPLNLLLIPLPFEDMFMFKFVATTTASLALLLTVLFTTTAAQAQDAAKLAQEKACMACHQIDKKEISYGTIGPSLYNYGKIRGVSDPASPASKAMVEYTWGKIWNAKAYNACSNMPRAGHMGILN